MSHMFEAKRREYTQGGLRRRDLADSPHAQFERWFAEAEAAGLSDPTAMVLATADAQGQPSQRIVLLKHLDVQGFVFYTNQSSRKGRELAANPRASLLFPWHQLDRQVKVSGAIERVEKAMAASYFASRPRESQLAAWASEQSQVIGSREALMEAFHEAEARFANTEIPLPDNWGGFRLLPRDVEFWQGGAHRLHDCFRYRKDGDHWVVERLAP